MKEHPSEKRMTTGKLTELALLTAVLVQLSGSLTMIAVQRSLCQNEEKSEQTE